MLQATKRKIETTELVDSGISLGRLSFFYAGRIIFSPRADILLTPDKLREIARFLESPSAPKEPGKAKKKK